MSDADGSPPATSTSGLDDSVLARFRSMPPAQQEVIGGLASAFSHGAQVARTLEARSIGDGYFADRRTELFGPVRTQGDMPAQMIRLENAIVTPRGFVVHGDSFVWDTTYINPRWMEGIGSPAIPEVFRANGLSRFDPFRRRIDFAAPPEIERIEGGHFLFNAEAAMGNFAHFVFDTLLQVPLYREAAARDGTLKPLFPGAGFRLPAARRLAEWTLGAAPPPECFTGGKFLRVEELHVPVPQLDFANWRISGLAARRLRALLDTALAAVPSGPRRHLYVSRRDATRLQAPGTREVRIANEAPLRRLLAEFDFVEVTASDLAGDAYFALFRNAGIVLGLHGAGLINVLLAPRGHLIELDVPGVGSSSLRMVAEAAGVPTSVLPQPAPVGDEVTIDLDGLRGAIRAVIG